MKRVEGTLCDPSSLIYTFTIGVHIRKVFLSSSVFSYLFLRRDKIRRVESTLVKLRIMLRTFLLDGILRHCEFAFFHAIGLRVGLFVSLGVFLSGFFHFHVSDRENLDFSFTTSFRMFSSENEVFSARDSSLDLSRYCVIIFRT